MAPYAVPPFYDSLLAKILVRGASREEAIDRMRRALRETVLEGVKTSIPFHLRLLDDPAFQEGHVSKVEMVRRRG
jgi:acetyl-CoA carboxylase biotin carboxylase subunit